MGALWVRRVANMQCYATEQTILDTVLCNDWSFLPLQGSRGKFLRFNLVCTCSSGCLEPHDMFRR